METSTGTLWETTYDQTALLDFLTAYQLNSQGAEMLSVLIKAEPALLSGQHFWRSISENGNDFYPSLVSEGQGTYIVAWSRIFEEREVVCAINFHQLKSAIVYTTIDNELHSPGSKMNLLLGPNEIPKELNVEDRNGKSVRLTIPPRELVIYG
jgi:hypothetical protein